MHIYNALLAVGAEMGSHESDLYIKRTDQTVEIVNAAFHRGDVKTVSHFRHAVTGEPWIEIPFAFLPWWENRKATR